MFECERKLLLLIVTLNVFGRCSSDGGQPTQPPWTIGHQNKSTLITKVVVNKENLKEAAKVREDIRKTIAEDKYAMGHKNESAIVQKAEEILSDDFDISSFISGLLGSSSKQENLANALKGEFSSYDDLPPIGDDSAQPIGESSPNIVNSTIGLTTSDEDADPDSWIALLSVIENPSSARKHTSRETLRLSNISEDVSFMIGGEVKMWKSFERLVQRRRVVVGLRGSEVIVLSLSKGKFQLRKELRIEGQPQTLETVVTWNEQTKSLAGIIIVALKDSIVWLHVDSLQTFWNWRIGVPVSGLRYFQVSDRQYLAVVTEESHDLDGAAISIYEFNPFRKKFWMKQLIPLSTSSSHLAFLDTGRSIFLAVPQKDEVVIFESSQHYDNSPSFEQAARIEAPGVTAISGFQMGGYSYIAVGGSRPQILRHRNGKFIPQTILGSNFGFVEDFLPISARTYRDDLILLVQHELNFNSHQVSVLEALIWDGEAFAASLSVPCNIDDITKRFGVSCLLDIERAEGIRGAAVVYDEENLSLLVPRYKASSGLYHLHTELVPTATDRERIEATFNALKGMVEYQSSVITEAQNFLIEAGLDENTEHDDSWQIDSLETGELTFGGDIGRLSVNEQLWTAADTQTDVVSLLISLANFQSQLEAFEREVDSQTEEFSSSAEPQTRQKREQSGEFDYVFVNNLLVEAINGVPLKDTFSLRSDSIDHDGTIIFESDVFLPGHGEEEDAPVQIDNLHVSGDLTVDNINGVDWTDFIENIVDTDNLSELNVDDLELLGDLIVEGNLYIDQLNGQQYPDQYLWSSGPRQSIVTGEKKFNNVLSVGALDCEGQINGISPADLVTLTDEHFVPGITTFNLLEVTNSLEINGAVKGRYMDRFLPNPTLLETNHVKSACYFNELEVNGPVSVESIGNGTITRKLNEILNDIVYVTDRNVTISSIKSFEDIVFEDELYLTAGLINDVNVKDFVTADNVQEVKISALIGNITFGSLQLDGLFDFVNVTELDENSIKTFGEQFIDSELVIENPNGIYARNLNVLKTLNQLDVDSFYRLSESLSFANPVRFRNLSVDSLFVAGSVDGNGTLNNVDMGDFVANYLSYSRDQIINGDFSVGRIVFEDDLKCEMINDLNSTELLEFIHKLNDVPEMVRSGEAIIGQLTVHGNVTVSSVCDIDFSDLVENVVWLNRANSFDGEFRFLDKTTMKGGLTVNSHLNGKDFERFRSDLVQREDDGKQIVLSGWKKFTQPVEVSAWANVEQINGIPFKYLAKRSSDLEIEGSLIINGDLSVPELSVGQYFNDFDVQQFSAGYSYDTANDLHIFNGKMRFGYDVFIENFYVSGSYKTTPNVSKFLESLVYKDAPAEIRGLKTFKNMTTFLSNTDIHFFNGLNLEKLLRGIVFANDKRQIKISQPVTFTEMVWTKYVRVHGDVHTDNLMGCSLAEWFSEAIRIDQPLTIDVPVVFHADGLSGNNLNAIRINGMPTSDILTLHTPQNISGYLKFGDLELSQSMTVLGNVNGVNFKDEYKNTLMVRGDYQNVMAPTTLLSVRVLGSLKTLSKVGEKDLREVVTLSGDQRISSALSFGHVSAENLNTSDSITGISLDDWLVNALRSCDHYDQDVTGNWTVSDLFVQGDMYGTPRVNGFDLDRMHRHLNDLITKKSPAIQHLSSNYAELCKRAQSIMTAAVSRSTFFRHFDWSFALHEPTTIHTFTITQFQTEYYLITNAGCLSVVYNWNGEDYRFDKVSDFQSGRLSQILSLPTNDGELFLITKPANDEEADCSATETLVWKFLPSQVRLVHSLGGSSRFGDVRHVVNIPGRFYAVDKSDNVVVEFEAESKNISRTWNLPASDTNRLRFLPEDTNLGISLSDGNRVYMLNPSVSSALREKRFFKYGHQFGSWPVNREEVKLCPAPLVKSAKNEETDPTEADMFADECTLQERHGLRLSRLPVRVPCPKCYRWRLKRVLNNVVDGLINDLEGIRPTRANVDQTIDEIVAPCADTNVALSAGMNVASSAATNVAFPADTKAAKQPEPDSSAQSGTINERLEKLRGASRTLPTPDDVEMSITSFRQFAKKVVARLFRGLHGVRKIHKAIDRVRGKSHLYVSEPHNFSRDRVHDSLVNDNTGDHHIKRPLLEMIGNVLHVLHNGAREVNILADDIEVNDYAGSDSIEPQADVVAQKYFEVSEKLHSLIKNLLVAVEEIQDDEPMAREGGIADESEADKNLESTGSGNSTSGKVVSEWNADYGQTGITGEALQDMGNSVKMTSESASEAEGVLSSGSTMAGTISDEVSDFSSTNVLSTITPNFSLTTINNELVKEIFERTSPSLVVTTVENVDNTPPAVVQERFDVPSTETTPTFGISMADEDVFGRISATSEVLPTETTLTPDDKPTEDSSTDQMDSEDSETEPIIGREISGSDYLVAENTFVPSLESGELITFEADNTPPAVVQERFDVPSTETTPTFGISMADEDIFGRISATSEVLPTETTLTPDDTLTKASSTDQMDSEDSETEPIIGREISGSDYFVAENTFLPSLESGELITFEVGPSGKSEKLVAVAQPKSHVASGRQDAIKIYYDPMQGHLFQTLLAVRPRSLTSIRFGDDTVLAFIEDDHLVKIYIYKGVQGFVESSEFRLMQKISILSSAILTHKMPNSRPCVRHFLIVSLDEQLEFYEAFSGMNCQKDDAQREYTHSEQSKCEIN